MSESALRALNNAAASSAMEGLPLTQEHRHIIEAILNGNLSLEDYLNSLKKQEA